MSTKREDLVLIFVMLISIVLTTYTLVMIIRLFVILNAPWYFFLAICTILAILGHRAIRDFKRQFAIQEITFAFKDRNRFLEKLIDRMDDLGLVLIQQSGQLYRFNLDTHRHWLFKYTRFLSRTAATVDIIIREQSATFTGARAVIDVLQRQILNQKSFERV